VVRLLILIVAVTAAVAAGWLSFVVTTRAPEATVRAGTDPVATVDVLVAAAPLEKGARLDGTTMRWHPWPRDALSEGLVTRSEAGDAVAQYDGKIARFDVAQGEPIRPDRLADPGAGFLSAMLPPGKRAVAIRISAESTAGGLIMPDDRVDVIHTRTNVGPQFEGPHSQTILRSVKVLAIDQSSDAGDRGGSAVAVGKTATLQLSPEQAELITSAQATGYLSMTLRAITDQVGEAATVSAPDETAERAVSEAPRKRTVVIYHGSERRTVETTDRPGMGVPVTGRSGVRSAPAAPRAPTGDIAALQSTVGNEARR